MRRPLDIRYVVRLKTEGQPVAADTYVKAFNNLVVSVSQENLLPADAVRKLFGADWGASFNFVPKPEFNSPYKKGLALVLRKDSTGWIYALFLYDEFNDQIKAEILNTEFLMHCVFGRKYRNEAIRARKKLLIKHTDKL